ncbi:MAG: hypothetical protein ACKO96_24255, partial [Flammeovirgaceae bacterium]
MRAELTNAFSNAYLITVTFTVAVMADVLLILVWVSVMYSVEVVAVPGATLFTTNTLLTVLAVSLLEASTSLPPGVVPIWMDTSLSVLTIIFCMNLPLDTTICPLEVVVTDLAVLGTAGVVIEKIEAKSL